MSRYAYLWTYKAVTSVMVNLEQDVRGVAVCGRNPVFDRLREGALHGSYNTNSISYEIKAEEGPPSIYEAILLYEGLVYIIADLISS